MFGQVEGRPVVAAFDGGALTSDAGGLLLGAADRSMKLVRRLARCFRDARDPRLVEHTWAARVRDRARLRRPEPPIRQPAWRCTKDRSRKRPLHQAAKIVDILRVSAQQPVISKQPQISRPRDRIARRRGRDIFGRRLGFGPTAMSRLTSSNSNPVTEMSRPSIGRGRPARRVRLKEVGVTKTVAVPRYGQTRHSRRAVSLVRRDDRLRLGVGDRAE